MSALKNWGERSDLVAALSGAAQRIVSLDRDWLFGGKGSKAALQSDFDHSQWSRVTLPHCVTPLSWQNWNPSAWEDVWVYRRHFAVPTDFKGSRYILHFDRVMAGAGPVLNGHSLPQHLGGFLPFEYEVTDLIQENDNVLAISVDSRWENAPPSGSPKGPRSIDYLLPGGINGSVYLRVVPKIFISDVFAKPVNVLDSTRQLKVTCQVNAGKAMPVGIRLEVSLLAGAKVIASTSKEMKIERSDNEIQLTLGNLGNITLWDVDKLSLYDVVVTLFLDDKATHQYRRRIGFREACFNTDGFWLNGRRLQFFGLNRHELFPYVGFAASNRMLRRDAEILRRTLNCNIVRCSHYPQSEQFLDACDELGLMVWEEIPGWQYLGDTSWRDLALRDVDAMVRRDRNHPSIIIWGVRINESPNDPSLYRRTREIAKSLDDSRPTSGSMTPDSIKNWPQEWHQDVFAFDDYHATPDGSVGINEPMPGVPYMLTETVGQFDYAKGKDFDLKYRRAGDPALQMEQALLHAQAHSKGAANPRSAGVIAWCAFDYASLMNAHAAVKCPGVADVFRIPKLGASFYLAQLDPAVRPVIEPNFYWDFGPRSPSGPGKKAAIFSNCDRIELSIGDKWYATLHPDRTGFPNIKYPPFFADLNLRDTDKPELHIDGYIGSTLALTRSFSADTSQDRLMLRSDDLELKGDGADGTRVTFGAVDKFGAPRPFAEGEVIFKVEGPGLIIGDNPFHFEDSGGAGAVWIKSVVDRIGLIKIEAAHDLLGKSSLTLAVILHREILSDGFPRHPSASGPEIYAF